MQQQPSFVAHHQMPLSLWSRCLIEQQAIYERAQGEATAMFKHLAKQRPDSPAYNRALAAYNMALDLRRIERRTLAALASYYQGQR